MLGMTKLSIDVNGMTCGHCEAKVVSAVGAVEGVAKVEASHANNTITVMLKKGAEVPSEQIAEAVRGAGFSPG